jgi:hypothetical protein
MRRSKKPFDQIELRLARADKHLTELENLAKEFAYVNQKSVTFYPNLEKDGPAFFSYGEPVETLGEIEAGELNVVIGDIVHNLRSTLNYLTVTLARRDSPQRALGKKVQFPIESRAELFSEHRSTYLCGVNTEHVAMIERVQPYNGCEWTKFLQSLSNLDKHVELVTVYHEAITAEPPDDEAEWGDPYRTVHVTMDLDVFVEVAFENGVPIVNALQELKSQVSTFIEQFKTDLR